MPMESARVGGLAMGRVMRYVGLRDRIGLGGAECSGWYWSSWQVPARTVSFNASYLL